MSVCVAETCTYVPVRSGIVSVRDLSPLEKLFAVIPDGNFRYRPGQFVQVSLPGLTEAPISISSSPTRGKGFEITVRRAGVLTAALHRRVPGDQVGIRGPFGTSFDVEAMAGKDLLLIAGGCGLAPMRSLIQYCADRRENFGAVNILYGAKSPEDVLFKDEIETWRRSGLTCSVTVDNVPDSSCHEGHVGLITTLIPPLEVHTERTAAVIIGPPVMYKFVIAELRKKGLREDQICVSLERYMRCGVGKCGHCTIEHLYCCIDGPVFWLHKISGLRGAL